MAWFKSAGRSSPDAAAHRRPRLLLQALEPRLMFDGAVAATVVHAEAHATDASATDAAHHAAVAATDLASAHTHPDAHSDAQTAPQVVFVESDVTNYKSLIAQLPSNYQVVVLDSNSDGLAQIAQWASTHQGYAAIHIISHGQENDLMLGTQALNQSNLAAHQAELTIIGQALKPGGDILLYGCDVAAGQDGAAFLSTLAQDTHHVVAASTDATGAASLGGNWTLESSTGHVRVATLDLPGYDGLLAQPVSGTTDFNTIITPTLQSGSSTGPGLTASNVDGWDFTLSSSSATNCYIGAEALTGQTTLIDGASNDGAALNYMSAKSNNGALFTLNSVDLAMSGASVGTSGTIELVGYLNGVAVSGAFMSQTVTDASFGGLLVTFNVSSNSHFAGIDSFRVVTDGSYQVTGAFGIDNINATNFHFPGPVVTTSGGSSAFSAGNGNAVAVDGSVTVSDTSSSTQASATVSITGNFQSGQDVLAFSNTSASTYGNIVGSYNSGTGVLSLSSSGSTATTAQWQAALEAVTYRDSSLSPNTNDRTISFSINDGSNTSSTVTKTVSVTADVAPAIANLNGDSVTYAADGGAVHLDSGTAAAVSDSDSPNFSGGTVTVHVSANAHGSEDVLGIDSSGTVTLSNGTNVGSTVSVSGVAIGTIDASGNGSGGNDLIVDLNANATPARLGQLVDALTYNNSAVSPNTATRTVQVTVNDGHGQSSSAASVTVAVSNQPTLTASGGSAAFTAGDNVVSTPVAIDSGITVVDPASTTLASGTVSITGNFHSGEDVLAFTNDGSTMGNIAASYNSGTGVLTLTASGATLAQWRAALESVTYSDSAITPNTATRTLSFQVSDGSNSSSVVTRAVTVADTDQTPIATASGGSAAFSAGDNVASTAVAIDSGITVTDRDNTTLASATVAITGNFHSGEDALAFSNSSLVTFGNIAASYNSGTGVLTLTSSGATATLAQWQAALRAVTYTDSAVTPNSATRTVSFTVNDGTKTSATQTRSVTVADTDQTPIVSVSGGSAAFSAGDNVVSTAVAIDSGLTVTDLDNTTLASATVAITGNFHSGEDVLAFTNNPGTMGNIAGVYNSGTGVMTLTSSGATLAQWRAALESVTYSNSAITPNSATRTVSFTVNDGTKTSATQTRSVTVADTDQTPIATTTGGSGSYLISASPTAVAVDSGITVTDRDNTTLASATVAITGNFQSGEDVLAFSNDGSTMGNIAASYNSGTGVMTLTSSGATLAQWQAALRAVTYNDTAPAPATSPRTISFRVNDGTVNSVAATRSIALQLPTPSVSGLTAGTDTGSSHSDGITSDTTPTVTGTATANSTVTVYIDGTSAGTTTADGSGAWSFAIGSALSDGHHAITAMATSGSVNSATSSGYGVTIETATPATPSGVGLSSATDTGSSQVDGVTRDTTPTIQGSAPANSTVTVYVDGVAVATVTADGSGAWSYGLTGALADGNHAIRASATDAAGNVGAQSAAYTITVDTAAPTVQSFTALDPVSTSASVVDYQLVLSKPLSDLSAASFSVVTTGSAHGSVSSVVQTGTNTYQVQLVGVGGAGTLSLALNAGAVSDVAGNALAATVQGPAYQLASTVVVTPVAPPAPVTPPAPVIAPLVLPPITPNIVLNVVSTPPAGTTAVETGGGAGASAGGSAVSFGADHFTTPPATAPVPTTSGPIAALPVFTATGSTTLPYVTANDHSLSTAFQVVPDLGVRPLQAGQGFNFTLPAGMVVTRDSSSGLQVQVRQSDGQPLPAWVHFDPVSGRLSGTPPAGETGALSLEIVVQDRSGHRGVSHIRLNVQQAAPGKQALNEQFARHAQGSALHRLAAWLQNEEHVS